MASQVSGSTWMRHLLWAESYFIFPNSHKALSSTIAFRFAGHGKVMVVRNKSNANYTGASIRALLIRITDSGELDHDGDGEEEGEEVVVLRKRTLAPELDFGNCLLELWDEEALDQKWPRWRSETKQVQCSSKWYTKVLGWSDEKIKEEFGIK